MKFQMNHAVLPRICDECLVAIFEKIRTGSRETDFFCEHTGTLAYMKITPGGTIVEWRLIGSNLTPARARHLIELAVATRRGIDRAFDNSAGLDS